MNKFILLVGSLVLAGCVTGYNPAYFYNEVHVHNLSGGSIENVSVRVGENGRSFACEQVNKNALCDDRFGKKRYYQNGIELNWTHPDGSRKNALVNPSIPAYFVSSVPLRVIIEILEDGTVKPYFEQDEPGRDGGFYLGSL